MITFKDYQLSTSQQAKHEMLVELLFQIRDRLPEPKKAPTGKKVQELKKGLKQFATQPTRKRKIL